MGFYGVLPKENITESVSFSVCYDEYLNRKRMLESCTDDNRLILESEVQLLREISFKDIINKIKDFFIFIGNKIRDFFKFITEKINELRIKIMVKRAVKKSMKELKTYFKQINAYDKVITDLDDSDFKFDRFEYDRFEYDRFEPDSIDLESTLLESGTTNAEKLLLIAQDPYIYYNSSDYFNMSNLDNFTSKVSNTWSGISREEEYEQKIKQDKANIFSFKDINPDDNYEDIKKKILSNMDKIRDAKCKRMTVKELIDRCETVIETEDKNFDILKKVVNNYSKEIKTQEENCIASLNVKTRVAELDNKDDDVINNFKKIKKSISESTSFLISVIRLAFDLNKSAIIACSKIANLNDGMRRSTEKYLGD